MPTHSPEDQGSYYRGEFPGEYGATVTYYEPENDDYAFDPDAEGEAHVEEENVLSGTHDEVSWADDAGKRKVARAVLAHHLKQEPDSDQLETFMSELASKWEDGQEWQLDSEEISDQGLER